jgi:hypothetical protein
LGIRFNVVCLDISNDISKYGQKLGIGDNTEFTRKSGKPEK